MVIMLKDALKTWEVVLSRHLTQGKQWGSFRQPTAVEGGLLNPHGFQNLKGEGYRLVWWHVPVIPALMRLRQKNHEFKVIQGYIRRPYVKKGKGCWRVCIALV
jgi:hypothetical protein